MEELRSYYYDQTGMAVLQRICDMEWKCVYNNPSFIKDAHDTRIYRVNGDIVMSYNDDTTDGYPLTFCNLLTDNPPSEEFSFSLSPPSKLLPNFCSEKLEKNSTLLIENVVLYGFYDGRFVLVHKDEKFSTPVPYLAAMEKFFRSRIFFSMGTPAIPYGDDRFLAVGHVKINHTRSFPESPDLQAFVDSCPVGVYHEKYIYLMFLFEFDFQFRITRMSINFIPVDESVAAHDKSFLVFPTGLYFFNNKYYITYGENDRAMRIINLDTQEVEDLLNDNQRDRTDTNVTCTFLEKQVVDVTGVIPKKQSHNTFTFNNSMIHWKDDYFICVYRHLHFDHPLIYENAMDIWKTIWNWDWDWQWYDSLLHNESERDNILFLNGRDRPSHVEDLRTRLSRSWSQPPPRKF